MKFQLSITTLGVGFFIHSCLLIALCLKNIDMHNTINDLKSHSVTADVPARKLDGRKLDDAQFDCTGDHCVALIEKHFVFPKGVLIGAINSDCDYGDQILSVDGSGTNCPQGEGSVTFGAYNTVSGSQSSVTGGKHNTASGSDSSVTGGHNNTASGSDSSVTGGSLNIAGGTDSFVGGGTENEAEGHSSSVTGGSSNKVSTDFNSLPFTCAEGWCTSSQDHFLFPKGIVVGDKHPECVYGRATLSVDSGNTIDEQFVGTNCPQAPGSVTFGLFNNITERGFDSSILGGRRNTAYARSTSILGRRKMAAWKALSTIK